MTPLKKDPQKEERILQAAARIFAAEGLEKGTIADIAADAGIGKGTVYQYFSSKDEIFRALLMSFFQSMIADWQQLAEMDLPPEEGLQRIIASAFDLLGAMEDEELRRTFPVLLEIMLYGFRCSLRGESSNMLTELLRDFYALLHPLMQRGVDQGVFRNSSPQLLSFMLFSTLDGLGMHYFLHTEHLDREALRTETIEFFMNAILKR